MITFDTIDTKAELFICMNELDTLKNNLMLQSPSQRLKFIRQKVVKKNQNQFCQDGIIRIGTLKSIETEKLKISPRIAERLVHKFSLEGVLCNVDTFLEHKGPCDIKIDSTQAQIIGSSVSNLEEIRRKLQTLTPIYIDKDLCPLLAPNGATALARQLKFEDLSMLNNTLCLIHGTQKIVAYLTYENNQILSQYNGKVEYFPVNIINFCGVYAIEILYFN